VTSITDAAVPAGFAPFGIRDINGLVYVTFANVKGGNGGFVDAFKEDGTPLTPGAHLIQGLPLNQPWGIAVAPAKFGPFSNMLLVSNNTKYWNHQRLQCHGRGNSWGTITRTLAAKSFPLTSFGELISR